MAEPQLSKTQPYGQSCEISEGSMAWSQAVIADWKNVFASLRRMDVVPNLGAPGLWH